MDFTVRNSITNVSIPDFSVDEIISAQISLVANTLNQQLEGTIRMKFFDIGLVFETDQELYDFCKSDRCHILVDGKTGINHLLVDDVEIFAWDYSTNYEVSVNGTSNGTFTINTYPPKA